jgi:hypothetical protein
MSDSILYDFKAESIELVEEMMGLLEEVEGDFTKVQLLEKYGQVVDRIMGGAKNMSALLPSPAFDQIGITAELCKALGYKASQLRDANKQKVLFDVVVAFLLDANEMMEKQIAELEEDSISAVDYKGTSFLNKTFVDRLKWISEQFKGNFRSSVATASDSSELSQEGIDAILKKLGM